MINLYKEYIKDKESRIAEINEYLENYQSSKDYLVGLLTEFKEYINNFSTCNFKDIIDARNISIRFSQKNSISDRDLDFIKRSINVILELNKKIYREKSKLNDFEFINTINDNVLFNRIIKDFNEKISDKILYNAYTFNMPYKLGRIRIQKRAYKKDRKAINWGESNKRKKELETNGKQLYKVIERDENLKPVQVQEGEKWIVRISTMIDYFWHWEKRFCYVENKAYYKFFPTRYDNSERTGTERNTKGNIQKLVELKNNKAEILTSYML